MTGHRAPSQAHKVVTARLSAAGLTPAADVDAIQLIKADDPLPVRYAFRFSRDVDEGPGGHISHAGFAASIAEALLHAEEAPLDVFVPPSSDDPTVTVTAALVAETAAVLGQLDTERDSIKKSVMTMAQLGDTALLADLTAEYEQLVSTRLPQAEDRHTQACADLVAAELAHVDRFAGLPADSLIPFLAALRDPQDLTFQAQWRSAMHDLQITVEPVALAHHYGKRVTWAGTVLLERDGSTYRVPFRGEELIGGVTRVAQIVRDAVAGFRCGRPLTTVKRGTELRSLISEELGWTKGRLKAWVIEDPALLAFAMKVLYPTSDDIDVPPDLDPQEIFTRPDLLAARLQNMEANGKTKITHPALDRRPSRALAHAAANGGVLPGDPPNSEYMKDLRQAHLGIWSRDAAGHAVLQQCPCGSLLRARLLLTVAAGPVCLVCRADVDGVTWPAEPYDRYLTAADLWLSAGYQPATGQRPKPSRRAPGGRRGQPPKIDVGMRAATDLTAEEQSALVSDYLESADTVAQVAARWRLSNSQLYAVIHANGDPRRTARRRRPNSELNMRRRAAHDRLGGDNTAAAS